MITTKSGPEQTHFLQAVGAGCAALALLSPALDLGAGVWFLPLVGLVAGLMMVAPASGPRGFSRIHEVAILGSSAALVSTASEHLLQIAILAIAIVFLALLRSFHTPLIATGLVALGAGAVGLRHASIESLGADPFLGGSPTTGWSWIGLAVLAASLQSGSSTRQPRHRRHRFGVWAAGLGILVVGVFLLADAQRQHLGHPAVIPWFVAMGVGSSVTSLSVQSSRFFKLQGWGLFCVLLGLFSVSNCEQVWFRTALPSLLLVWSLGGVWVERTLVSACMPALLIAGIYLCPPENLTTPMEGWTLSLPWLWLFWTWRGESA